jgi:hypothetical protein
MKKNHADEQFLARRSIRELPEQIARLTRRAEASVKQEAAASLPSSEEVGAADMACSTRELSHQDRLARPSVGPVRAAM